MNEKSSPQVLNSHSGNLKSKIQNLKWDGIVAIVVTLRQQCHRDNVIETKGS